MSFLTSVPTPASTQEPGVRRGFFFGIGEGQTDLTNNQGSLPGRISKASEGLKDVVSNYPWTISDTKKQANDIPYIRLIEYYCNESAIYRQKEFYEVLIPSFVPGKKGNLNPLEVYKEIFPKDQETKVVYKFPYFNETSFELSTPNWKQLEPAGEALKSAAQGLEGMVRPFSNILGATIELGTKAIGAAATGAETAMKFQYPVVNVFDRPRIFAGHNERQITVSFPLFNTIKEGDWIKNYELIYLLMWQNLFSKRDVITGISPVFYDVYIPGQYYCYAACMTDINVKNLGNTRLLGENFIVPDAYQVTLTLTEMVQPSRNQFSAINGAANNFVTVSTRTAEQPSPEKPTPVNVPPASPAVKPSLVQVPSTPNEIPKTPSVVVKAPPLPSGTDSTKPWWEQQYSQ